MGPGLATIYIVATKSWLKLVSVFLSWTCLFLVGAYPVAAQPVPGAKSSPIASVTNPANAPQPASSTTNCPDGAAWLCVTQSLQRVMFNPDGSHRSDRDIATDAARVIAQLIKDGLMKAQSAPTTPIRGFEDANKYVNNYPTSEAVPAAPSTGAAAGSKSTDCPPDRAWLCFEAPVATNPPAGKTLSPVPPAKGESAAPASQRAATSTQSATQPTPASKTRSAATMPATSAAKPGTDGKRDSKDEPPLYVFGPNDVISVTVFDERNVTGTYSIGPDGRISMPLIHTFTAVGYTIPELTDVIGEKLREEGGILEPVVNIQLLRSNSKQYTLIGAVGRAGPVPLLRETKILDALAASGFREFAGKKKIILRRGTKDFHFNYNEVIKGKHPEQNIVIEDGDLIIVPGD